jgi:D-alanyl-D-alanine carboxypeptidase/D-alanyl-D-alanine-endopeptidase (penicillin-binding protein 4)
VDRTRARAAARLSLLTLLVLILLAAAGVGGYLVTWHVRTAPGPRATPSAPPTPSALRNATASAQALAPAAASASGGAGAPAPAALGRAITPLLAVPALGRQVAADVIDPASGDTLYAARARRPGAPASTAKLLTAAAVLSVLPPTFRITTTARLDSNGTLVVVGAGDPTLTAVAPGATPPYLDAARLSDLAGQVMHSGRPVTAIEVDDGLFRGPDVSPAWAAEDVPSSYASAITPFMTDGGRAAPADQTRSAAPDLAAAHELAALLHRPGLPVRRATATSRAAAGTATVVGQVRSAPLSVLVEQMLQESDNVIAECLARQVALAVHRPASFVGAAAAIAQVLQRTGVTVGDGMVDGSGLAASDRLPPVALTGVLRQVASRPRLSAVAAGLPVAGWSGTLADRYVSGASGGAAGVVRAKTGTLTGVSTLAGLVHDRSGRLLVFAVMADHVRSTPAAEAALDDVAARLARCGCGRSGG